MNDKSFNRTVKIVQTVAIVIVAISLAIIMYHGVIEGGFSKASFGIAG